MISWKLKTWRTLGAAALLTLAACGQPANAPSDDDSSASEDSGESGENSGGEGGESGESGESGEGG